MTDPLAKFRYPGALSPVGSTAVSTSGIKQREYQAFETDASRCSLLMLKRGLIKNPATDLAIPYHTLTGVISDGYGFGFSMTFSIPHPVGAKIVEIRGEGLTPLLEGILRGTVKSIQIFDPERFLPPKEGAFDKEADEWKGEAVVRELSVTDKDSPNESNTRH